MIQLKNISPNLNVVSVGDVDFYFSYETLVAFDDGAERVCSENVWSATTAKHLNAIQSDKSKRIPHEEFKERADELSKRLRISA